jgi:hypothetical protein
MADEEEKIFNKVVVGQYYAICVAPSCGLLIPVPIIAYQKAARKALDSAVIAEPDLTQAMDHFTTVHPDIDDVDPALLELHFKD